MTERSRPANKHITPTPGGLSLKQRRTPAEHRAEIERVAREHGADLSEEGFNEALRKVAKREP